MENIGKMHKKILSTITEIRNSNPIMLDIFLQGSCFNLYHILKTIYPDAECFYSITTGHAITRINDKFYDITGEISDTSGYLPINKIWTDEHCYNGSLELSKLSQMYRSDLKPNYVRILKTKQNVKI